MRNQSSLMIRGKLFLKKRIWLSLSILCIIISAVFWVVGKCSAERGKDFFRNLTIQADATKFTQSQLQSMLTEQETKDPTEKIFSLAGWTEQKNEIITRYDGGSSTEADVITVCGSSYCLLPYGKNLCYSDKEGCIIGRKLAQELFGDSSVRGQKLTWQGKTWTVRDVLDEPAHLVMVQAQQESDELLFDYINISLDKNDDRKLTGENFILQNNLSAHILRWDYLYEFSWLTEMIPGKWSDFDEWKQNFENHRKAVNLVKNAEKTSIQSTGTQYQKKGRWLIILGLLSIAGALFFLVFNRKLRRK